MRAERIDKDYLAVVWGKPVPARGTINLALDRDPWDRRRVTVTDRGGQPSVTKYERLAAAKLEKSLLEKTSTERGVPAEPLANSCSHAEAVAKAVSLLRCRLVTGRMHQIRVHLAHRGWPLVGDATYGLKNAPLAFPRQALHAWRVALTHPVTRERIDIEAPLPEDMQALLERLHLPAPAGERD